MSQRFHRLSASLRRMPVDVARNPPALDVDIEFLDAAGDGIAHHGRQRLVVPFTIPGERVRVIRGPLRNGVAWASVQAVLKPSPHRVTPRCRHFGLPSLRLRRDTAEALGPEASPEAKPGVGPCGGCTWQHIAYPEQLRLKSELVTRLVREAVPRAPAAKPMLPGTPVDNPWSYRHKVHFVFGSAGGRPARSDGGRGAALVMGHYVRGSRRVIPVQECPVHDERGNTLAFRLRHEYSRAGIAAAPEGPLKSIAVRVACGSPEVMATLVLARDADRRLRAATRRVLDGPDAPASFHVNLHPKGDAFIFGRETRTIAGAARMRETVADVSFLVSPTAFFQTNVHAAEILVARVVDLVGAAGPSGARVLDLYAGAGLFALPLARAGHEVIAVEENRAAVADGEASRRLNRVPEERCRFVARRVEQALEPGGGVVKAGRRGAAAGFDVVILDPPRDGCARVVLDRVFGAIAPAAAIYVSCNPEALARDLAIITRHGYRIRSMQPVDMFPHTAHVETVVELARA